MEKGKILKIGYFDDNGNPLGWHFDCLGKDIPEIAISESGEVLWAGYSIEELREIAMSN